MTEFSSVAPSARGRAPDRRGTPTFSVVIAAFQAAETVAEAVESALAQTLPPHEVIVVDDGSTDGTAEVLAPFVPTISVIRQENRGAPAAKNAGVRAATGEFFAILDADDLFLPRRLEMLRSLAEARPDLDILMTDVRVDVDGRPVGRFCESTPFATDSQRLAIFDRCFVIAPAVRRRPFLEAGGFDESIRSAFDWDCWIRLLLRGSRVGLVDEALYIYRMQPGSLSDERAYSLRKRVDVLEGALRHAAVREEERPALERSLDRNRRRAMLAEVEAALRARAPGSRARALSVVSGPGFGIVTRAKALAAALAPRGAGRWLDARDVRTGRSRLRRSSP